VYHRVSSIWWKIIHILFCLWNDWLVFNSSTLKSLFGCNLVCLYFILVMWCNQIYVIDRLSPLTLWAWFFLRDVCSSKSCRYTGYKILGFMYLSWVVADRGLRKRIVLDACALIVNSSVMSWSQLICYQPMKLMNWLWPTCSIMTPPLAHLVSRALMSTRNYAHIVRHQAKPSTTLSAEL
jgi:hypothetical protein